MSDFLRFLADLQHRWKFHVEVTYSHTTDWIIHVYRKGYNHDGTDQTLCYVSSSDLEYACAKAHAELKENLLEYDGGY